jgi:hypothetical protein
VVHVKFRFYQVFSGVHVRIEPKLYMNPTKNLIKPKLYMNSTENLIEHKHIMNPTKNLIEAKLYILSGF